VIACPLLGYRVVDFGLLLPVPFASRLLSDLGAEVICVHPPGGDPGEELLPGLMPHLTRGKRAIRLDLKIAEGRALALELAASADVMLEGFRPGVAERLGIGFNDVSARRPGIIYCSVSGYGQTGPKSRHAAHDANIEASGGVFAGSVAIGEKPVTPYLPTADLSASMFAATSVLAALLGRERAEEPTESVHLDVSMEESVLQFALPRWGRYLSAGTAPAAEDLVAYSAGAGIFETSDGRHVAIAAIEDPFWKALAGAMGRPDLATKPFDTYAGRSTHRADLRATVAATLATLPSATLVDDLSAAGVPITLVRTADEVAGDQHLHERGALGAGRDGLTVAHPVVWSGTRPTPRPTPADQDVLDLLGCTPERRQALRDSHVVIGDQT
jgi:CoA:oxalate CoA-transferase